MTKTTNTNERNYSVYIHLLRPTREMYIGASSRPYARWNNGRGYKTQEKMNSAVKKYDWNSDAWVHLIVKDNLTKEEAVELEKLLIEATDSVRCGLNTALGDETLVGLTEEIKSKIAKGRTGQHHSDETKAKISASRKEANKKRTRPVVSYNLETGEELDSYPSAKVAEEKLKMKGVFVSRNNISAVCHGKMRSSGGRGWKFAEWEEDR